MWIEKLQRKPGQLMVHSVTAIPRYLLHLQSINRSLHQSLWGEANHFIHTQKTDCEMTCGIWNRNLSVFSGRQEHQRPSHPVSMTGRGSLWGLSEGEIKEVKSQAEPTLSVWLTVSQWSQKESHTAVFGCCFSQSNKKLSALLTWNQKLLRSDIDYNICAIIWYNKEIREHKKTLVEPNMFVAFLD